MNDEQRQAFDLVLSHLRYYGDYHHRKEQMAYAVAVLYLGAAATLLFGVDPWPSSGPGLFGFIVLALVTAACTAAFVWWQLDRRRWAADLVGACVTVTSQWLTHPPDEAARESVPIRLVAAPSTPRQVELPRALAEEFDQRLQKRESAAWLPSFLTLCLMGAWSLAILIKFTVRLSEVGLMDIKLLTPIGLGLDVVGVLGLGLVQAVAGFSTNPWVDFVTRPRALWAWGASWVAIFLGFVFQFVAAVW